MGEVRHRDIAPGLAPGGLVFRLVAANGELLVDEPIIPPAVPGSVEAVADRHAVLAMAHSMRTGRPVTVVVYDGDDGQVVWSQTVMTK